MAIGDKYASLTSWLQRCGQESIHLSFRELNTIIEIPDCAYRNRPSWSNPQKPSSFNSAWLNAGYRVSAVDLNEQWVEFTQGQSKSRISNHPLSIKAIDPNIFAALLHCGYDCYDATTSDPNHRYLSWEHCHEAFRQHRQSHDENSIDYLCLHLAWYLANWGMLRNSFLMQKDYKIHTKAVKLICAPEWNDLWDISADKMADVGYARRIIALSEKVRISYIEASAGVATGTLLTKILLGTVGCAPAYDRFFRHALSLTGIATQSFTEKSIIALGKFYMSHETECESLRQHCSERIEYPAAKIIDMCFFEYGYQNRAGIADE